MTEVAELSNVTKASSTIPDDDDLSQAELTSMLDEYVPSADELEYFVGWCRANN